jgi:hypothetical protein
MLELRNIARWPSSSSRAPSPARSRGLHYTLDHLETDPAQARDTVIKRGVSARLRPA